MSAGYAKDLARFIDASFSQFHAVKVSAERLLEKGFTKLDKGQKWTLQKGGKYFITNNSSALIAFEMGTGELVEHGFRMLGSHTDSPTFRVKPNPEILQENAYLKLNTEVYGGVILNTWFDRELSLAGRVSLRSTDPFHPEERLVNIDQDLLIIPSLCIHMNREVNESNPINKQKHVLPILATLKDELEKENLLVNLLAKELGVDVSQILDFELYLYNRQKSSIMGLHNEFISAAKLDNLAMVHASLCALLESKPSKACKVMVAYDNEEVGSMTRQGANSPMLRDLLERICLAMGLDAEEFHRALSKSVIISADMAHAVHPNYPEKSDPTNRPVLNGGPVVKRSASFSYTSDAISIAMFRQLCEEARVPFQDFVNRSDLRGGSTIGPINSQNLDILSIDVGNPLLAMHSVRELGGVKDHEDMIAVMKVFYSL